MKLKYLFYSLFVAMLSSCNYLDIVPDEVVKEEDTYETPDLVRDYLYSCYSFLPTNREISNNAYWMMCGAETSFYRKEMFSTFNEGTYSPSSLHMTSDTCSPIWEGIRQCYMFLDILDKAKGLVPTDKQHYRGEANFLIAYYHFLSLRSYGPTLIIDKLYDPKLEVEAFPERSSYDEVVDFINKKLDEAFPDLPSTFSGKDFGRATQAAIYALKSRLYLYAASPLFNGNSEMYADFKSKIDGRNLISQEYSEEKWQKSAEVSLNAISELEKLNFRLYDDQDAGQPDDNRPSISNPAQRRIRYSVIDFSNPNPEVIWADTREEGYYDIQNRSIPRQYVDIVYDGSGGIAPTLQMVEYFYTKNGLPIDKDKTFDYEGRFDIVELPVNYDGNNYSDVSNGTSIKLHLDREPRFYANIGFHHGFFEITQYDGELTNDDPAKRVIIEELRNSDKHGKRGQDLYYSVTGYHNKKFVHPAYEDGPVAYPLPLFRMAEMYLNYAEALVELNELELAKEYIDKVRIRAGIPGVDEAWNNYSTQPGYQNTQEGLREIVRQERLLEFYLEGLKFFDIRRWKIAEKWLGVPDLGLNVAADDDEGFFQVREVPLTRSFHKGQYLMPIPMDETNKMPQLVQNPYYN